MRPRIAVIGGGITGQMVQWAVPDARVFDWKSPPVGRAKMTRQLGGNFLWAPIAGVACREFDVVTEIDGRAPTLDAIKAYKEKIGKDTEPTDTWEEQFRHRRVGYEFEIDAFPTSVVTYDHRIVEINWRDRRIAFANGRVEAYDVLVSTIPLYSLLSQLNIPEPPGRLKFRPIYVKTGSRPPDAPYSEDVFYVNYISTPVIPYRYTDRDGERHYESLLPMGESPSRRLTPGKIYPHPGVPDILKRLQDIGIYTFGRYGSWDSNELVHETWNRIRDWKESWEL